MKKALMIVVALALIGLVVYLLTANKDDSTTDQNTNTTQNNSTDNTQTTSGTEKTSLQNLVASGNKQCTYTDGQTTGTVYTSNGKARMDMSTVTNGVATSMHSVIDNNIYYSWVDGQPSGFKFSVAGSTTGSVGSNQNVDVNRQLDYNCINWGVDNSKFTLPASVQFTDLSSFTMPK